MTIVMKKFRFLISILSDVVSVVISVWNHVISKDLSLSQFYKSYNFHHFDQNTIWWHTSFLVILLRHLQQHFKDNTLPRATPTIFLICWDISFNERKFLVLILLVFFVSSSITVSVQFVELQLRIWQLKQCSSRQN